jgi:uncharacterized membrane protein
MKQSLTCVFVLFSAMLILLVSAVFAQQGAPTFSDVDKIFQARCDKCHSGARPPDGLRLDSYAGVMAGSKDMKVVVKGDPGKSELVKRIKGISKPRMPKDGPPWLPESDITLVEKWIASGAAE